VEEQFAEQFYNQEQLKEQFTVRGVRRLRVSPSY